MRTGLRYFGLEIPYGSFSACLPGTRRWKYSKTDSGKGFNIILVMLTGVDLREDKLDRSVPFTNIEGEEPWIDNDPLKPNEKYFEHIDKMIRLGRRRVRFLS